MEMTWKQRVLRGIGRLDWLRGRDRVLRFFSHPDHQKAEQFETDFFGLDYTGHMNNFIDWTVFYYGAYALHEIQLLGDLADALRAQGRPVNFFDVGANIGHHTFYMSQHADRVFSFEPFAVVRDEMQRKLKHAGVGNVTVFPVALGDRDESGTYTPPTGANQGTGTLGALLPDNASTDTIPVAVMRGDGFFQANDLPSISLLKMDVEGYELKVLEGLKETIWRDRPPMLMEVQPQLENALDSNRLASVHDLLYPNHLLFEVDHTRGRYVLKPYGRVETMEALVLPAELAGILPGTRR
jgi:FkbM family methyltransferase